jgi:hypothetical protein
LVLMGQNGLAVFCVSVPLSVLASVALLKSNGWVAQLAVNLVGFGTMVAVAGINANSSRKNPRQIPYSGARATEVCPFRESGSISTERGFPEIGNRGMGAVSTVRNQPTARAGG